MNNDDVTVRTQFSIQFDCICMLTHSQLESRQSILRGMSAGSTVCDDGWIRELFEYRPFDMQLLNSIFDSTTPQNKIRMRNRLSRGSGPALSPGTWQYPEFDRIGREGARREASDRA